MRSHGSYLLGRLGHTQKDVALAVAASEPSISLWQSGRRKPRKKFRERFRDIYGIPIEAWDEDARPTVTATPTSPANGTDVVVSAARMPAQWGAGTVQAQAATLSTTVQNLMDSLNDPTSTATPIEKAKVASSIASTLNLLGKLTGDIAPLTTDRILRSPQWRRIVTAAVQALARHPSALKDFRDAMLRVDG